MKGWKRITSFQDYFLSCVIWIFNCEGFPITFYVPWCMTIQPSQFTQGWQGVSLAIARSQGRHPGMWNLCDKPVNCGVILVVMIYTGVTGFCGPTPDMSMSFFHQHLISRFFLRVFLNATTITTLYLLAITIMQPRMTPLDALLVYAAPWAESYPGESWVSMIPWGVGLVYPSLKWPAELDELWDFRSLNCLSPLMKGAGFFFSEIWTRFGQFWSKGVRET